MTTKRTPRQEFMRLVKKHNLNRRRIAELLDCSPDTVKGWLATPGTAAARNISPLVVKLLQLRLEQGGLS